jgi:5-methylcytosine-specific restriction endonuclease McrA
MAVCAGEQVALPWTDGVLYRAMNKDYLIVAIRASQERRSEQESVRKRGWRTAHPQRVRDTLNEWRRDHPEYCRDQERRTRHRKQALAHERIVPLEIYERDQQTCKICGLWVDVSEMSLDHIVPMSVGGGYLYSNLQLAHGRCNSRRGAGKSPAQTRLW